MVLDYFGPSVSGREQKWGREGRWRREQRGGEAVEGEDILVRVGFMVCPSRVFTVSYPSYRVRQLNRANRYYLHYHSTSQVLAGYTLGLGLGSLYFGLTEYVPLYHPRTILGQVRQSVEDVWTGVGGVGGWDLGGAEGGWGEGRFVLGGQEGDGVSRMKTA